MSTMLEQAIIDAAALRETAMKNAEASLIEKYSKEFKDTVEKLLEQDMAPDAAAANAADPTGPTLTPPPAMPGMGAPVEDKSKKVFEKVKTAFFQVEGDDEELITINFDGLKAKPVEVAPQMPAMPAPAAPAPMPEAPAALEESLELELEEELDESYNAGRKWYDRYGEEDEEESEEESEEELELELQEMKDDNKKEGSSDAAQTALLQQAADLEKQAGQKKAAAAGLKAGDAAKKAEKEKKDAEAPVQKELEETIELTEEEINELEESLYVDAVNKPEGYMGSHKRKEREFKNVAFARARDKKQTAKREKAKKTYADLQEALEKIAEKFVEEQQKANSLKKSNNDLLIAFEALKEQVEATNLSNAKLLYTNKVLSNASLNERQKNQIVENITKASSVTEAKTIYETLQSAVASQTEKAPKSLSEALNRSGPSPFLARQKSPASINDLMSERMKLLAGIQHKS